MKIHVVDPAEKVNFKLLLPSSVIFSNFSAWVICKAVNSTTLSHSGEEVITAEMKELIQNQLKSSFGILRKIKKKYPKFVLVDIETASGEKVLITL